MVMPICEICLKKCKGQAIKLSEDKYIHLKCFKCGECTKQLSPTSFYAKNGAYFCLEDYRRLYVTKCHSCGGYIEGEAVTALGNTYHRACLRCVTCSTIFSAGDKVTFNGSQWLCHTCLGSSHSSFQRPETCSGTDGEKDLLSAVHMSPLSSLTPNRPGEFDLKRGQPSPDSDYSTDNKEYTSDALSPISPASASSCYKSEPTFDAQRNDSGRSTYENCKTPILVDTNFADENRRMHLSPNMHFMHYRSVSPGSLSHTSRKSKDSSGSVGTSHSGTGGATDYGKFYKSSFLEKINGFKRGPSINPKDSPKQHFHRPLSESFSYKNIRTDILPKAKKGATKQLVALRRKSEPYRPFKNQDAIQLSKLPGAQKYDVPRLIPIERDGWPAPPEPAAVYPELLREHRHRRVQSHGNVIYGAECTSISQNKENTPIEMESGSDDMDERERIDPRIEKEIEHLSRMPDSGAARIILEDLRKRRMVGPPSLDPRSSSRTPSASTEPLYRTRYESSVYASPSRDIEMRTHLSTVDDGIGQIKYRTMTPPVAHHLASGKTYEVPRNLVRNYAAVRPGYGLRSPRLEARSGYVSDGNDEYFRRRRAENYPRHETGSAMLDRYSYNSSQSDLDDYDINTGLKKNACFRSPKFYTEDRQTPSSCDRRSIPLLFKVDEPSKIFEYEHLHLGNRIRPPGVDESKLEENLSREEFESIFNMSTTDFYHLPEWKRNDLKRRVKLF